MLRSTRAVLAAGLALVAFPVAAHAAAVPATEPGVALTGTALAHAFAKASSHTIERVYSDTLYTGSRTVLPVLGTHTDARGRTWLHVRLPSRGPHKGWIVQTRHMRMVTLTYHLVVSIHSRKLTVYRDGKVVARYPVVVGKPSTPTPLGQFFIVEHVRLFNSWAHGQWALASSAYSSVLKHFEGGIGQVALHAKATLGDPLGTAASHGCVRLADGVAASLARRIPNGTPLTIQR
jgi:lipoprotein-anchoring transpeptidase ErfK/SrfK